MASSAAFSPFSLLVKPAGADCNLRCDYCFYLQKSALYPDTPNPRMPDEVLERLVASYLATAQPQYAFGWQGGEPTLLGVSFFQRVTELQQRHGRRGAVVANGLQTNGTLLNEELAAHFARFQFLLGISLDGSPEIHDAHRRTLGGQPTHARVIAGIELLRRHHVEFNILTLVTPLNASRATEVYRYLTSQGFLFHQYIPCVEFDAMGQPLPFALTGELWGRFLCDLFDAWYPKDTRRVSIRLFDSILYRMAEGRPNVCHMGKDCRQYFMIEHNGDVYPCDFFAEPRLRLGNIMTHTWEELLASPVYREFGLSKTRRHPACENCPWLDLCQGDCLKHRFYQTPEPRQLSHLCEGWKRFFAYTADRFSKLAEEIRHERAQRRAVLDSLLPAKLSPPSRNAPCPCGSGRKFKHCCARP